MPAVSYLGLSGQGSVAFDSSFGSDLLVHYAVTNLGNATPLDPAVPIRYAKIGWVTFYEHNPSLLDLPAGDYHTPPVWLEWQFGSVPSQGIGAVGGIDGFAYRFYSGVVVDLAFG